MNNGTPIEELERNLNLTIEEVYNGLYSLAAKIRANGSPDDSALLLEKLAWDMCKRWPICFAAHEKDQKSV